MNVQDFQIMTQKHAPWLLEWTASQTGQHRMPCEADKTFAALVAGRIQSIKETPWEELSLDEDPQSCHTSTTSIFHRYTIVWRKNEEKEVCYTDTKTGRSGDFSVDKLLRLVLAECKDGDTVWIEAVVETIYTLDTSSAESAKHKFIIYPCKERGFMSWVDQNKESINEVLAQRNLTLSSYTVVALNQ